ncbi:MAG: alkane 1-monooxygenase [Flavobacteriaceae bacterium]|nr:alkane 1-monooxygenase [Flavobacteriaceae bacterium]
MRDLKYLFAYTIPISVYISISYQGYFSFTSLIYAYGFIPFIEFFMSGNSNHESEKRNSSNFKNLFFDLLLYLNLPIVVFLLFYGFLVLNHSDLFIYEQIGIIFSLAILLATNGINVAHELGHRSNLFEQTISKILLMFSLYMHFYIEHNKGHHKNVGTELDPATAKFNQNLYSFWISSTIGQYKNAWIYQLDFLKNNGLGFYSFKNQMLFFTIFQLLYLFALFFTWGFSGIIIGASVAVISFLMLETINYIEHYGLSRKKSSSGRYERVQTQHSWNSEHYIGRIVLYELTRHSDHHYKTSKKYQFLENKIESPQLPFGYPTSMIIAMIPTIWFSIMNKQIEKYRSANSL